MAIKEIDGKERVIIYADRIDKAEEFLYIGRSSIDIEGVFIYTKTGHHCHKFCKVDQTGLECSAAKVFQPRSLPDKHYNHWQIADKVITCEEFDRLMSFALDHHILEMPSQKKPMTFDPSVDVIGVSTKDNSEHWYTVHGLYHARPEYDEIMDELLAGEEGQSFIGLIQF